MALHINMHKRFFCLCFHIRMGNQLFLSWIWHIGKFSEITEFPHLRFPPPKSILIPRIPVYKRAISITFIFLLRKNASHESSQHLHAACRCVNRKISANKCQFSTQTRRCNAEIPGFHCLIRLRLGVKSKSSENAALGHEVKGDLSQDYHMRIAPNIFFNEWWLGCVIPHPSYLQPRTRRVHET